jgi:CRP-like cAMP-binding protein
VRAGSILGEPSLFGEGERMANVRSLTPCTLWALSAQRFEQMAQRAGPPPRPRRIFRGRPRRQQNTEDTK